MKGNSLKPIFLMIALICAGPAVFAQEQEPPYSAADAQQAQAAASPSWSADQLDNLVAPIALYPDPLLGQILVAATYPLEVVEAYQWLQRNLSLKGQALVDAAKKQPWDPSIQALVAVPDALARLNQDVRWTTDIGNAFLSQQADVMSAVQRMRARAQANGKLTSTPQQTVTTQEQSGQQAVVIQPASPQVIYVPSYDPVYVWGPPVYGYYPSLYYPSYGFHFGFGFDLGFCFGGWGGWGYWGWGPSWFGSSVYMNPYFFHHHGYHYPYGGAYYGHRAWVHNPVHRAHVPYSNSYVASRYGGNYSSGRNSYNGNGGSRSAGYAGDNRMNGRSSGGNPSQALRQSSPSTQRAQNPPRQQYDANRRARTTSQPEIYSSPSNSRYQGERSSRVTTGSGGESARVIPFGGRFARAIPSHRRCPVPCRSRTGRRRSRTPRRCRRPGTCPCSRLVPFPRSSHRNSAAGAALIEGAATISARVAAVSPAEAGTASARVAAVSHAEAGTASARVAAVSPAEAGTASARGVGDPMAGAREAGPVAVAPATEEAESAGKSHSLLKPGPSPGSDFVLDHQ